MGWTSYLPVLLLLNGFYCVNVTYLSRRERDIEGAGINAEVPLPDLQQRIGALSTIGTGVGTRRNIPLEVSVPMLFTSWHRGKKQLARPGKVNEIQSYKSVKKALTCKPGKANCNVRAYRGNIYLHPYKQDHRNITKIPIKINVRDSSESDVNVKNIPLKVNLRDNYESREVDESNEDGSVEYDRNPPMSKGPNENQQLERYYNEQQQQFPNRNQPNQNPYQQPHFNQNSSPSGGQGYGGQGYGGFTPNRGDQSEDNEQGGGEIKGQSQNNAPGNGPNQGQGQNNGQGNQPEEEEEDNPNIHVVPEPGQLSATLPPATEQPETQPSATPPRANEAPATEPAAKEKPDEKETKPAKPEKEESESEKPDKELGGPKSEPEKTAKELGGPKSKPEKPDKELGGPKSEPEKPDEELGGLKDELAEIFPSARYPEGSPFLNFKKDSEEFI